MISRCENSKDKDYANYGNRGITVCKRWHDVSLFISDIDHLLGPRPFKHSLDRVDNNGGYNPNNVQWATCYEQYVNSRNYSEWSEPAYRNSAEERWLPVARYAGFYEVSDFGNVASLARSTTRGCLLKVQISPQGYRSVRLSKYGHVTTMLVGSLVLTMFDQPRPKGKRVRHGPGGKLDDSLGNLYWG